MITQEYRGIRINDSSKGFFIINTISKEDMMRELWEYKQQNPEQKLKYYINPTRPQKKYLTPEYSMEVRLVDKDDIDMFLFQGII